MTPLLHNNGPQTMCQNIQLYNINLYQLINSVCVPTLQTTTPNMNNHLRMHHHGTHHLRHHIKVIIMTLIPVIIMAAHSNIPYDAQL